jgi:hypothetical protein
VAYGENGNFLFQQFTNQSSIACTNSTFGLDPAQGLVKKCLISGYTPGPPYGYSFCAATCSFTGTAPVAYGANGSFIFKNLSNGTACNNTVFGNDPAPGTVKGLLHSGRAGVVHRPFMPAPGISETTRLLRAWAHGDQAALGQLTPRVYRELRRIAGRFMQNERLGGTMQATALVHETCVGRDR